METIEFLSDLRQRGVALNLDGERLRCGAPEGTLTPALRDEIAGRKDEIVAFLRGASPLPRVTPAPAERHLPFPLTETQQAYWIGQSGAFELGDYSIHGYVEIDVPHLDVARLSEAWRKAIARHGMLRAVLLPGGEQQILDRVPPYTIAVHDLRGLAPAAADAERRTIRGRLSHQVLPLEHWPPFEILVSRTEETRSRLHVSIDGLFFDLWSFQTLFREIDQLYANPETVLEPPSLSLSFRDYVLAERRLQESWPHRRSLAWWCERIATLPPAPDLPRARSAASLRHPEIRRWNGRLDAVVWTRLKERAAREGLTPSGVLLAAFCEILGGWSASPRFTVNVPLFNRLPLHPEVNKVLGNFSSFTLVEADRSATRSVRARAASIQEQLRSGLEHQVVSGVRILRELHRSRGEQASAAMPVVFTCVPSGVDGRDSSSPYALKLALGDVVHSISQTPQVWLDNQVHMEEDGGLTFNWDVVAELFAPGMIDEMCRAYGRLLERLASEPGVWDEHALQLIAPEPLAARHAQNRATAARVPETTVHALVAARAAAQPLHPAVISTDGVLAYGDLVARAHRLAGALRREGVGPGELVAVSMEKGWAQVVGVLGALLAGAAHVAIDPALPDERHARLLRDSEARVLVTQSRLLDRMRAVHDGVCLCVDAAAVATDQTRHGTPSPFIQTPADLACVVYTSGSTGDPKGVMLSHRGLVNVITHTNSFLALGPSDRTVAVTSLDHDMGLYDLFGTLAAGGTIVMPDPARAREPAHWVELIAQQHVTVWSSVPAMMVMLVSHLEGRDATLPSTLRVAILGGDFIPLDLPARMRACFGGVRILSVGGPTETTVWNIWHPIAAVDPDWKSIPYGRPIANSGYHVLGEGFVDCPVWVPGEMYCEGAGLSMGYWRDPEHTANRFVVHPRTGERLYRTGDRGRYLPDGTIEILGRIDHQISLRGHRIEPGEIEAALARHASVRTAAVTVAGEGQNRRLVAVVVAEPAALDHPPASASALLDDPVARADFKLQRRALRSGRRDQTRVHLSKPDFTADLSDKWLARQSYRRFVDRPVPLARVSALLAWLLQRDLEGYGIPKSLYPSGGGLYPVQTYVYVKPGRVEGLPGGTYYHHPVDHELLLLHDGPPVPPEIYGGMNRTIFERAAFALFLVADLDAITPMYGDLAERLCLLEAGYMGQLLMAHAPGEGLGLCPIGAIGFDEIRPRFDLSEHQTLLHSLVGGGIEPAQTRRWLEGANAPATAEARLIESLKDHLGRLLPAHMVPSVFVLAPTLPLTRNGKLDRVALGTLAPKGLEHRVHVSPRTETERRLAAIWMDVLSASGVGALDDFFELGGDSLSATQVLSRVRSSFALELPLRALFEKKTLEDLAVFVDSVRQAADDRRLALAGPRTDEEDGEL